MGVFGLRASGREWPAVRYGAEMGRAQRRRWSRRATLDPGATRVCRDVKTHPGGGVRTLQDPRLFVELQKLSGGV